MTTARDVFKGAAERLESQLASMLEVKENEIHGLTRGYNSLKMQLEGAIEEVSGLRNAKAIGKTILGTRFQNGVMKLEAVVASSVVEWQALVPVYQPGVL